MALRGTTVWQYAMWGYHCRPRGPETVDFYGGGRAQVDSRVVPAFRELNRVLVKYGYKTYASQTGGYNCRQKIGGSSMSNHSWATAVDINWNLNPYSKTFKTNMPTAMIREILNIKTNDGLRVFRWGGDWNFNGSRDQTYFDTMHFEIYCTPGELAKGIRTVSTTITRSYPVLREGDGYLRNFAYRDEVTYMQSRLRGKGYELVIADGKFGPTTEYHLKRFQRAKGLTVDGICGPATWAKLRA